MSPVTFAELGLPSELVEVLDRKLITEPFEIQTLAVPDALVGRDILGRAPTGSGKTLAFGLPMLARLGQGSKKLPRGLVLSPTRELAEQICRELEPLAKAMDRQVLAVYGGVGLDRQVKALRKGVDVVVACPGRLLDLINQKAVRLDEVDIVVVDEADRMADMGFLPDVRKLLDQTSADRQTLLFSATLDKDVQVLIDQYQHDPAVHQVGEVEPDLSMVDHRFIRIKKTDRVWLAADIIADAGPSVVFVRTRHGVDRLARQLKQEGVRAGYIHGGRSQSQRDRALKVFIDGKVDALVATDVAARGIHVDGVACVIHFDPPADVKDYVHRSGRTARAGAEGMVVSFLDGPQVKESEKMLRKLALDADIESPPPRRPRSTRPATIDDRDTDAPKRSRGSRGGSGKPGKPKTSSAPRRSSSPNAAGTRAVGARSDGSGRSGESRSATTRSRPARSDNHRSDGPRSNPDRSSADRSSDARSDSPRSSGARSNPDRSSGARSNGARSSVVRSSDARSSAARSSDARSNGAGSDGSDRAGSGASRFGRPGSKPGKAGSKRLFKKSSKKRSTPGEQGSAADARTPGRAGGKPQSAGRKRTLKAVVADAGPKRSGKPRPKNRKNKPKATGRK